LAVVSLGFSNSAVSELERLLSKMTCCVSLNSVHSITC